MSSKTTDSIDSTCTVCSEQVTVFAVGRCDHPICYRCSTRMRVLCEQLYCAICRTNMPKVVFIKKLHKFNSLKTHNYLLYQKSSVYFENQEIQRAFFDLLEIRCNICKTGAFKPFRTFDQLDKHMKREHNLFYCDLCVKYLKIFPGDRKTYDRKKLAQHRRTGDEDDKSHRGHPLCQFCDERYLDNDELAKHLRKDHYYCHFCDTDGISNQFYDDYNFLRDHFSTEHYLCEEADCASVQFTNAFRFEIDMKAHVAQQHTKSMRRSQAKQARTIEMDITLAPRPRNTRQHRGQIGGEDYEEGQRHEQRHGSGRGRYNRHEREQEDMAKAMSASLNEMERKSGHVSVVNRDLVKPSNDKSQVKQDFDRSSMDFPTLDGHKIHKVHKVHASSSSDEEERKPSGSKGKSNMAKKVALANNFSVQDGDMVEEAFPSLGGDGNKLGPRKAASGAWTNKASQKVQPAKSKAPSQFSNTNSNNVPGRHSPHMQNAVPNRHSPHMQNIVPNRHSPNMQSSPVAVRKPVVAEVMSKPVVKPSVSAKPMSAVPAFTKPMSAGPAFTKPMHVAPTVTHHNIKHSSGPVLHQEDFPTLSSIGSLLLGKESSGEPVGPWVKPNTKPKGKSSQDSPKHQRNSGFVANGVDGHYGNRIHSEEIITPSGVRIVGEEYPTLGNVATQSQPVNSSQWTSKSKQQKDKKNEKGKGEKQRGDAETKSKFSDLGSSDSAKTVSALKVDNKGTQEKSEKEKKARHEEKEKKSKQENKTPAPVKKSDEKSAKKKFEEKSTAATKRSEEKVTAQVKKSEEKSSAVSSKKEEKSNAVSSKKEEKSNAVSSKKEEKSNAVLSKKEEKSSAVSSKKEEKLSTPVSEDNAVASAVTKLKDKKKADDGFTTVKSSTSKMQQEKSSKKKKKEKSEAVSKLEDDDDAMFDFSIKKPASTEQPESVTAAPAQSLTKLDIISDLNLVKEELPDLSSLSLEDFPSMGGTKQAGPPPGFGSKTSKSTAAKPPPGFAKSSKKKAPPPGFVSETAPPPDVYEYDVPPESLIMTEHYLFQYVEPDNAQIRNQKLIGDIQIAIRNDEDLFNKFKNWSGLYRQDGIHAEEYYNRCEEIMGVSNFRRIFPELVALLPDIRKQRDLLQVHENNKMSAKGKKAWIDIGEKAVRVCQACGQVVTSSDFNRHSAEHNLDSEFPALGGPVGHNVGLNAWVKAK